MTDEQGQPESDPHIDYEQQYPHPPGETYTQRMTAASSRAIRAIFVLLAIYLLAYLLGLIPGPYESGHAEPVAGGEASQAFTPPLWAIAPFAALLLSIAVLPLIGATEQWWHHNRNRFIVAAGLGLITLFYYAFGHPGGIANHFTHKENVAPGLATAWAAFSNGIFSEFIPFIVLLFSLYVISGGINLSGDVPAHPKTNTAFIGLGTLLASFIGTTGAAMVLIRPLLTTNQERKYTTHTVIFFIFCVCNCGGLLLPIGDPPLFLGYLRGVPFTWTLGLWPYWVLVNAILLIVYYIWDTRAYGKEQLRDLIMDEKIIRPLRLTGRRNFFYLLGVVLSVALIVPDQPFLGTAFKPPVFFREAVMLLFVVASLQTTDPVVRVKNRFDYTAITEVAALFSGIFICMQVPIEILHVKGTSLGVDTAVEFFWITGILSSFLDNAPTYVVFFETAIVLPAVEGAAQVMLTTGKTILADYLVAISLASVFMGANTYIGNGPNFMVKSIAEQSGIKMPSFFGYMFYSVAILVPIFVLITFLI